MMHVNRVSKDKVIAMVFFFPPTNMVTLLKFQTLMFYCLFVFSTKRFGLRNVGTLSIQMHVIKKKTVTIVFNMSAYKDNNAKKTEINAHTIHSR